MFAPCTFMEYKVVGEPVVTPTTNTTSLRPIFASDTVTVTVLLSLTLNKSKSKLYVCINLLFVSICFFCIPVCLQLTISKIKNMKIFKQLTFKLVPSNRPLLSPLCSRTALTELSRAQRPSVQLPVSLVTT